MANVSSRGTTCYLVPPGTLTPHLTSPPPRDAIYIWGTAILGHTHTHTHTHSSLFPARHPHFYTHTHTHTSTLWSLPCQAPTLKHTHTHTLSGLFPARHPHLPNQSRRERTGTTMPYLCISYKSEVATVFAWGFFLRNPSRKRRKSV